MKPWCWSVVVCLVAWTVTAAEGQMQTLWQIGKADDRTQELGLAPDGYARFDADPTFVVGQSDARDWPYCHPGPADTWAGGTPHTFTILFGLSQRPAAPCRLRVDLVDTHPERPPVLRIRVNDRVFEHECPKGGADASIMGDPSKGKEHTFAVDVPPAALKPGLNRIAITNTGLSWIVYDWLGFEVPPGVSLAGGATIESVTLAPWLSQRQGKTSQEVVIEVFALGQAEGLSLHVAGLEPRPVRPTGGKQVLRLRLPPVAQPTPVRIALKRGDAIVASREVVQTPARRREPADYVDCLMGTSTSRWMLYPGPSMPFGMVKLSPDNQRQGWKAGYEYTIPNIAGFSHLHAWTMGGLLIMPTTGPLRTLPGAEQKPDEGYRSRFRHETETAVPGYYAVTLDDYDIRAELTATTRAGFQRYTFPEAREARILVDLLTPTEYGYNVPDARITKVSDTEIEGYSEQQSGRNAPYQRFTLHFVARTSKAFTSMGTWVGDAVKPGATEVKGKGDVGCFLNFQTKKGEQILLQTGVSLVSIEQARLNLETEMKPYGWDFDACRAGTRKVWNDLLGRVEVEGGSETDKLKFYTNMYRAYCARTIWSDVNGQYVDMYEKVQQLPDPDSPVYGCDAFWNTFWNLNQLWVLVTPDVAGKWVRSLLEINDKGGWLPKGPTGIEYSSIMVASHEIALIVAAYQAGIHDFDAAKAYQAMRHIQTTPGQPHPGGGYVGNRQLAQYMKLGYVPSPVSNTLEYAYDDWCVAQMAKALGKTEDYEYFLERSRNYRNIYDPMVGFMRRKNAAGRWVSGFSPFDGNGWVEGNSWQFTWFVPHDVGGLVGLLGKQTFNDRLDAGLERSKPNHFNATGDRMADFPINHGNQPNMESSWLFNYSGKPWLTQKWTREILDGYYGAGPLDGWPGDEDQGQMGAWYVMSAMGLFQMDGGCAVEPVYEVASPLFDRIVIHLDPQYRSGKTFVIETHNNSKANCYIQSATLDGKRLSRPWFHQRDLFDGGSLVLELGPEPNASWGSEPADAPPSIPR